MVYAIIEVKDGKMIWKTSREMFHNNICLKRNGTYKLELKQARKKRTVVQNKYYWVLIHILSDETGFSVNEMHEVVKYKFLTFEKVIESTGEVMHMTKSTTELSTQEFNEFIEQIKRWASQSLSCVLPDPDEQLSMLD